MLSAVCSTSTCKMNEGRYNKSTYNDGYVGDEVEMETKINITKVDAGVGFIFQPYDLTAFPFTYCFCSIEVQRKCLRK